MNRSNSSLSRMEPLKNQPSMPPIGSAGTVVYNGGKPLPGGNLGREENWIKQIAEGNLEAFERLYRVYQNRLFVYLYRMLDSREAAEEVLNDVIHGIWKGAAGFKGQSRPSTWIFGIARNKALSRFDRRRVPTTDLDELSRQPDHKKSQEEDLVRKDMVERALGKLSTDHREVVELTFYSGLSYEEIAEIVHIPVNTVKTRMFHARLHLRKILEK